jgi:hypothetical protein
MTLKAGWSWEKGMRQIPAAYWSDAFGAVFAYATRDDVHACCVTWRDEYIVLSHDELKPPPKVDGRPDMTREGMPEICDLAEAVWDAMCPHVLDGGGVKRPLPRKYNVGEAVFGYHLFWSAVHAPGDIIRPGFGRPPRVATAAKEETRNGGV